MASLPAGDEPPAIWALVPIKRFERAKERLAHSLSAGERRALMLAMARDVLTALSKCRRLAGTLIVSRAPEADALAQAFGAERFAESPGVGLSPALEQAAGHLRRHFHAAGLFIVPADVPLIEAGEVDALVHGHRQVTLLPDERREGTNGLICSPPGVIAFAFDGRSFKPHAQRALAAGIRPRILPVSGFSLDLDRPRDLAALLRRGPGSQTGIYLQKSGIAERLAGLEGDPPKPGQAISRQRKQPLEP